MLILCGGMVWYGMVWYGMVWYGMVWYGMVWYGMVWYGMVWYGMVWYANDNLSHADEYYISSYLKVPILTHIQVQFRLFQLYATK